VKEARQPVPSRVRLRVPDPGGEGAKPPEAEGALKI